MRTVVATLAALLLTATVAQAKPTADEAAAAREHYKRGTTLYDLGKYVEAIQEFQQAYEIKDDPVLLYNIAQSFRLSNQYSEALRFYKTYLRRAPKAPNRDEVETKIADMENLIQQQQRVQTMPSVDAIPPKGDKPANIGARPATGVPAATTARTTTEPTHTEPVAPRTTEPTTPDTTEPTTRTEPTEPTKTDNSTAAATTPPRDDHTDTGTKPGRGLLIGGIVIAAVGVAALGAGIGMGALASSKATSVQNAPMFDPSADSQGKMFNTVGLVLDIVGGVAVAAGVVVAVLGVMKGKKGAEEPKVTFAPVISPTTAGAALNVRF